VNDPHTDDVDAAAADSATISQSCAPYLHPFIPNMVCRQIDTGDAAVGFESVKELHKAKDNDSSGQPIFGP